MKRTHPVALASVLDNIVDSQNMRRRMDERRAVTLWPRVVGEAMAAQVRALEAANQCLRLRCHNSILRQEIALCKSSLLTNLNALLGSEVIKDLIFV